MTISSQTKTSDSLFKLERIKRFPTIVWLILFGTFLARTSYFMAWPFLIVVLFDDYHASEAQIGLIFAVSAAVASVFGLYVGYLSDKLGRKLIMLIGCIFAGLIYYGIGGANELWQLAALMIFAGLMRPTIEAPGKAVISDNLDSEKDRELALNMRYFILNAGGAIGPLLGISLALSQPQTLFYVTGVTYFVYALMLGLGFHFSKVTLPPSHESVIRFRKVFMVIANDRLFMGLLIANILLMFVYSHIESSIPQVLARSGLEDAVKWIGILVVVNTCTVILLQFPLLALLEKKNVFFRTRLGVGLMGVAQVIFIFTPEDYAYGWVLGTLFLSIGEVIAFPTLSVQIDRLAPAHLKGSYFGAASLYSIGFAAGPLVGGWLLSQQAKVSLFVICLLCVLAIIVIYYQAQKMAHTRPS
ncbi:MDR family MFS transporter [Marinomonas sp. PE14-40]|uniref:MDR family MFS transporter n=1 Tax=Marinomonas sp. PE14-40 TaxID=3060621 RepID=UPI003F664FA9